MSADLRFITTLLRGGIFLWLAAGVIAFFAKVENKIIWTCVSGAALGFLGIAYTIQRKRKSGL